MRTTVTITSLVLTLTSALIAHAEAVPRELYKTPKPPKPPIAIPDSIDGHKVVRPLHCSARGCRDWREGDPVLVICDPRDLSEVITTSAAGLEVAAKNCP